MIEQEKWVFMKCAECQCDFYTPIELYVVANRDERVNLYCPYGHCLHFNPEKAPLRQPTQENNNVVRLEVIKGGKDAAK